MEIGTTCLLIYLSLIVIIHSVFIKKIRQISEKFSLLFWNLKMKPFFIYVLSIIYAATGSIKNVLTAAIMISNNVNKNTLNESNKSQRKFCPNIYLYNNIHDIGKISPLGRLLHKVLMFSGNPSRVHRYVGATYRMAGTIEEQYIKYMDDNLSIVLFANFFLPAIVIQLILIFQAYYILTVFLIIQIVFLKNFYSNYLRWLGKLSALNRRFLDE